MILNEPVLQRARIDAPSPAPPSARRRSTHACSDEAALRAVVERHREAVVRQHGLRDRRDLGKHLADVEHARQHPQQLLDAQVRDAREVDRRSQSASSSANGAVRS